MYQATTYQPKTASPTSFGIVVLLHGAAIAALVFARMEMPAPPGYTETDVEMIEVPKPPEPEPLPPQPETRLPEPQVRHIDPVVPPPPRPSEERIQSTQTERTFADPGPHREAEPLPKPEPLPPPVPVRKAAKLLSGDLEPPYPISEQRAGTEGSVTVRLAIGTDGRVVRAEKVRATSEAFFQATQRHAMRNWRFRPATVDGRPIESSTVMTVHFKLDGDA